MSSPESASSSNLPPSTSQPLVGHLHGTRSPQFRHSPVECRAPALPDRSVRLCPGVGPTFLPELSSLRYKVTVSGGQHTPRQPFGSLEIVVPGRLNIDPGFQFSSDGSSTDARQAPRKILNSADQSANARHTRARPGGRREAAPRSLRSRVGKAPFIKALPSERIVSDRVTAPPIAP